MCWITSFGYTGQIQTIYLSGLPTICLLFVKSCLSGVPDCQSFYFGGKVICLLRMRDGINHFPIVGKIWRPYFTIILRSARETLPGILHKRRMSMEMPHTRMSFRIWSKERHLFGRTRGGRAKVCKQSIFVLKTGRLADWQAGKTYPPFWFATSIYLCWYLNS